MCFPPSADGWGTQLGGSEQTLVPQCFQRMNGFHTCLSTTQQQARNAASLEDH